MMTTTRASLLYGGIRELEEFERIPLEARFPHKTCYGLILESAQRAGDEAAVAVLDSGHPHCSVRQWTFRDLIEAIERTANVLLSIGLAATESVAILLPPRLETHAVFWGAQAVGIAAPINPYLSADSIGEILMSAASPVIVVGAPEEDPLTWSKLPAALARAPGVKFVIVVSRAGMGMSGRDVGRLGIPSRITAIDYTAALEQQIASRIPVPRGGERPAAYFHTGGTTGTPKIAVLSDAQMVFSAYAAAATYTFARPHVVLSGLPMFHIFGGLLTSLPSWSRGGKVVYLTERGYRDPDVLPNMWHHIERFRANGIVCVPTILHRLMDVPVDGVDLSSFEAVLCGGAPLPEVLRRCFRRKFGVRIAEGYGLTETAGGVARQIPSGGDSDAENVGIRLPYSRIRIVELEGTRVLRDCETDEPGDLIVKGPQVFRGYLHLEHNRNIWTEDGWFMTGDRAQRDSSEVIRIVGRAKDLIIRGGHNIDPLEIEQTLLSHPAIAEAVAVGQPDSSAGELPCAFVTLKAGCTAGAEELMSLCRSRLSDPAGVPVHIAVIDAIPVTAVGKYYRPALRDAAIERVLNERLRTEGIAATLNSARDAHGQVKVIVSAGTAFLERAVAIISEYGLQAESKSV